MDDFFSVPAGAVAANEPTRSQAVSSLPTEALQHRGKWIALRRDNIIAVKDTLDALRKEIGAPPLEVSFFHVPPANTVFLR